MAQRRAEKSKPKPAAELRGNINHGGRVYEAGTPVSELKPPLSDAQTKRLKRLGLL